jgi:putative transport protein
VEILHNGLFALFLIIALGLVLGQVRIRGLTLDVSAVIFVALILGTFGVQVDAVFQTIGLVLFVFSVGIQSGPGFVASFRHNAVQMIGPVLLLIALSAGLMLGLSSLFNLNPRLALGLLTGARSSNSALAVGVSSTGSNLPALGHSLAYPLGVLGALFFVRLLPRLLGADLRVEEKAYQDQQRRVNPPLVTKTFTVRNPNLVGKTLGSLQFSRFTGVNLSRIMHRGEILIPTPTTVLAEGDLVKAVGPEPDLENVKLFIGPETTAEEFVEIPLDQKNDAQWVLVTNRRLLNKSLEEVGLGENFAATVTRLKRHEVELTPHPFSTLRYGDLVMVVGAKGTMAEVKNFLGGGKPSVDMDFLPMSLTIVLGLALGSLTFPLWPGFTFSFGVTGGVLVTALVLSAVGKTGPVLWHINDSSLRFVRQLGLLLFLTAVGTNAGAHLWSVFNAQGVAIVVTALTISLVPLLVVALVCRFALKMNMLTLLGLIAGGTTCSPALAVATTLSSSNVPTVAYSTVYPFAMITMMIAAQFLALIPV